MHYYQFNIGDYQSHTNHLSDIEDLAYRRMLDWCYLHEKPLPKDVDEIARLIRMRSHSDCIANVLREFFKENNGYISERVVQEINLVNSKSEKAKLSANARWSNKINNLSNDANAMRTHSESNATHNTRPITQDTIKERATKVAKSTRLSIDWQLPDEWAIWAKQQRPDLNVNQVADGFKDYWISEAKAKADWFATWRNWIRKQRVDKQDKIHEAPWQKAARLRMAEFAPGVAAQDPNDSSIVDMEFFTKPQEIKNVTTNSGN
jgi:uncharacterized protein YdaU (DUF1376 family)